MYKMIKDILVSTVFMYGSFPLMLNSLKQNPFIKQTDSNYYNLIYNYSIFSCGMVGYIFGMIKMFSLVEKFNNYIETFKNKEE